MKLKIFILSMATFCIGYHSNAQVKELNILKFPLKLHGVELRLGFPNLQTSSFKERDALEQQLATEIRLSYNLPNPDATIYYPKHTNRVDNSLEAGIIFKPLYTHSNPVLRSVEVKHNFGLNDALYYFVWDTVGINTEFLPYGANYSEQSVYYNGSVNVSSPSLFNTFKLNAGGDFQLRKSLLSEYAISKNSSKVLYEIDQSTITDDNRYQQDYFDLSSRNLGFGYSAGIKVYLNCYLNLQLEYRDIFSKQTFVQTQNQLSFRTNQFLVGMRYKFTPREENPGKNDDYQSAFW